MASRTTTMCSSTAATAAAALLFCALAPAVAAHSQMTQPQSTSPITCRLGGEAAFGVDSCRGPCDLRAIRARPRRAAFWSPAHPAAQYARGQRVQLKYTRNNHGPGGFVRLTLVPPGAIMDRAAHARNAFHYSCWGAQPVRAAPAELRSMRMGFSMVGSDGEQHPFGKGYYVMHTTIPTVVPDGNYVLGWAWYGGTGSALKSGTAPQMPGPKGYFGDYYSCAFVRIRGGPTTATYHPQFVNDMSQFSSAGCMASTDRLGPCAREPCYKHGYFRRPAAFANGRSPPALTAANFGAGAGAGAGAPAPPAAPRPDAAAAALGACQCLAARRKCAPWQARASGWACRARVDHGRQSWQCKQMCCRMCYRHRRSQHICWHGNVRPMCGLRRR